MPRLKLARPSRPPPPALYEPTRNSSQQQQGEYPFGGRRADQSSERDIQGDEPNFARSLQETCFATPPAVLSSPTATHK